MCNGYDVIKALIKWTIFYSSVYNPVSNTIKKYNKKLRQR